MGELGATYDVYLRLIGKRVIDFLSLLIELFLLGVTAKALQANIDLNRRFRSNGISLTQNFRQKDTPPQTILLVVKRVNGLPCGIKMWAQLSSVLYKSRV